MVPGFPTGILLVMGLLLAAVGYVIYMIDEGHENSVTNMFKSSDGKKSKDLPEDLDELKKKKLAESKPKESDLIENIMKMEVLELKLGFRLLQLVQGDSELL